MRVRRADLLREVPGSDHLGLGRGRQYVGPHFDEAREDSGRFELAVEVCVRSVCISGRRKSRQMRPEIRCRVRSPLRASYLANRGGLTEHHPTRRRVSAEPQAVPPVPQHGCPVSSCTEPLGHFSSAVAPADPTPTTICRSSPCSTNTADVCSARVGQQRSVQVQAASRGRVGP